MQVVKTLKFKIQDPNEGKTSKLNETLRQYRKCVNFYLHEIGKLRSTTKSDYQSQYEKSKNQYDLPTALIQQARDFALEQYKSHKNNKTNEKFPHFESFAPVDYDDRTLTLKSDDGYFRLWCSLSTTQGRVRVPIEGGDKHYRLLEERDFDVKSAKLRYDIKDDEYYLDIHVKKEVEIQDATEAKHYIGVDLGVNNLATIVVQNRKGDILETKFFDGSYVGEKRRRFRSKRREYMLKGLWSKLRDSKGQEARFMKDINHKISKYIKDLCKKYPESTVVMEKLDGIRDSMKFDSDTNAKLHNWNFGQLQEFIIYKVHDVGSSYRKVPPHKTSQVCRDCFSKITRSSQNFVNAVCKTCKKEVLNADLNAAVNIIQRLWYYLVQDSLESAVSETELCESSSYQGSGDGEGGTAAVGTKEFQLVSQLSLNLP